MNFQRTNNITGWIAFAVALITYWLTFEETASYWDCGEFIAVSYKLEVPHPPGAPLFLLLDQLHECIGLRLYHPLSVLVYYPIWQKNDECRQVGFIYSG